ncbi:MAG: hypothetical protein JRJ19_15400 [Deltaproteobacteria bacterium]|nr:hypothetical protein [Deltaproteobacteria bacterium]MBW1873453.1 hypothetical protein [Deltaproteobacteria bacterium]
MARHLFIAQKTLSTWLEQDKIDFDNNMMTIKADGRCFRLLEAVRFVKVEGDDEDRIGLLGRVKTNTQLLEMGAERYRDSVIYDDVAYKVQEGFIGEVYLKKTRAEIEEPAPIVAAKPVVPSKPAAKAATSAIGEPTPILGPPPVSTTAKPQKPVTQAKPSRQPEINVTKSRASPLQAKAAGAAEPGQKKDDQEKTDEELLTKFLLDNL